MCHVKPKPYLRLIKYYQNGPKFSVKLESPSFEVFVIVDERQISRVETVVRSVRENAE